MVVSRKQMTPKKPENQYGGSRKQMNSNSNSKKPSQYGGSRKSFTSCNTVATRKAGQAGGAHKTDKHETMHEICVACHRAGRKEKVRIDDVRKETFKGKGNTLRARLVGKCEHGHKWYRITKA